MTILDRYIRKTLYGATGFVTLILLGIQSFLLLVQEFRHIGQAHYGVWDVFLFVPMQLPAQFYQLFPMAGFLGCLIGLGRLATSSQLIVMRASGVSIGRITFGVIKAAIVMIVVATLLGEVLGPFWQQKSLNMRQHALHPEEQTLPKSIWLRQGNTYMHIAHIDSPTTISDITQYHFNAQDRLKKVSFAQKGTLNSKGQWTLYQLRHTHFYQSHTKVTKDSKESVNLLLRPNLQVQVSVAPAQQTMANLYRTIRYRQAIGLSVNQLIYSFVQRLLQPFTALVMICLGVPFVFGSLRSATMGVKVLIGVVMGFAFYMLNQLFGPITLVYQYPPVLAALTPTIIFTLILFGLLARIARPA